MALTKRQIDSFTYAGSGKDIRWDDQPSGFGVRIYRSGKKSLVVQYRKPGQRSSRFTTLGRYGVLTLDQARKKARRFLVDVGDGADPLDGRPPTDTTIKQFAKTYVQDYAKGAKKTWRGDERGLEKHVVPALGSKTSFTFGRSGGSVPERAFPCLRSRVTEVPGIVRRLQTLQENHHDHLDLRRSVLLLYTDALRGASWSRRSTRMRGRSP